MSTPTFPILLERFFTQRLMQQRQASAHTIASYRDTFRLLLKFVQKRFARRPGRSRSKTSMRPSWSTFLDDLEKVRKITPRTRNLRLTAIHSFFRYVAFEAPAHAAQIQRVLAIPPKRFARKPWCRSSTDPKSMRCLPRPISGPGRGGAITHSSCSPCRLGYGSRS